MSATLDSKKFMDYFGVDSLVKVEGRSYPIEVYNSLESQKEDYLVCSLSD